MCLRQLKVQEEVIGTKFRDLALRDFLLGARWQYFLASASPLNPLVLDGGIYESFDDSASWKFVGNLPLTQFYKLAVDDAEPFYNIYGGTQDNNTQGGPSRTFKRSGISNADWYVVLGGDGHQPATEPGNPDIIYAQSQQGYINRIDMTNGEAVSVRPQEDIDLSLIHI